MISQTIIKRRAALIVISSFVLLSATFFIFRKVSSDKDELIRKNIETILSKEANLSNIYSISKYLVDFERYGMVKCSKLEELQLGLTYYNTLNNNSCLKFKNFSALNSFTIGIRANNGRYYNYSYVRPFDVVTFLLEFIIYIFLFTISVFSNRYLTRLEEANESKLKSLEIEKQFFLDHTQQISHDIASPLSAISMLISLIKNIDPEIKSVLLSAVEQTRLVSDELKSSVLPKKNNFDVIGSIKGILDEKRLIWEHPVSVSCHFDSDNILCIGNESDYKSIFSNLLNNAYEAMLFSVQKTLIIEVRPENTQSIVVKLTDSGIGIPEGLLENIGKRGFTFGKRHLKNAGSGLGLFNAIQLVESWGGNIKIKSRRNYGTEINITLPLWIEHTLRS